MKIALYAKCFEDNSKVKQLVTTPGQGKVLVVDGGGSKRHTLLGDINVTVTFAGLDFIPGQFVYADNNGVLVAAKPLL